MTVLDLSCMTCCQSDSSSSGGADPCNNRGDCLFTWDGASWNLTSNSCSPDDTPAPGECPGGADGTWTSCICPGGPTDFSDGDFIGETRTGCCACALDCGDP